MFETVVPEAVVPRSRKLFYQSLPFSLAIHGLVAGAALTANVWTIEFPKDSPRMFAMYSLVEPPPPPPPPPPPLVPRRATPVAPRAVPVKMPLVAPPFIPDEIPVVSNLPEPEPVILPVVTETAPPAPAGVEGGIEGGEVGGTIGGIQAQPLPELIKIERDLPLPMASVSQEFPQYPEYARTRGWEDTLVVRYIIGKNGRVKDVSVIKAPMREDFSRAALEAIRHWRFQPFRDEKGEAKEVVHELTVEFKIFRKAAR
jgi:periplasmic protein TonB